MKQTSTTKRGLQYHYYTCYNHLKFRSCRASQHTFPAELIEQQIAERVVKILKSPEVLMSLNRLAEKHKDV